MIDGVPATAAETAAALVAAGRRPGDPAVVFDQYEQLAESLDVSDRARGAGNATSEPGEWFTPLWCATVFAAEYDLSDAEAGVIATLMVDTYHATDSALLHTLATQLVAARGSDAVTAAIALWAADEDNPALEHWDDLSGHLRAVAVIPIAATADPDERARIAAWWDQLPVVCWQFAENMSDFLFELDGYAQVARTVAELVACGADGLAVATAWLRSPASGRVTFWDTPAVIAGYRDEFDLDPLEVKILQVLAAESSQPFRDVIVAAKLLAAAER